MKNYRLNQFVIVGILCLSLLTAIFISFNHDAPKVLGSIDNDSGGYYSTTTPYAGQINGSSGVTLLKGTSTSATGTVGGTPNTYGILGSVVVTGGPKAGTMALYDATTSDVTLRTGALATSSITLADFPAGIASSTYTFDVTFKRGLLLVTTGAVSTTTITWK